MDHGFPGLLEDQEGVGVRGARSAAALGMRTYRLSDVEEDDDMLRLPQSSLIYTFTNRYLRISYLCTAIFLHSLNKALRLHLTT